MKYICAIALLLVSCTKGVKKESGKKIGGIGLSKDQTFDLARKALGKGDLQFEERWVRGKKAWVAENGNGGAEVYLDSGGNVTKMEIEFQYKWKQGKKTPEYQAAGAAFHKVLQALDPSGEMVKCIDSHRPSVIPDHLRGPSGSCTDGKREYRLVGVCCCAPSDPCREGLTVSRADKK